VAHHIYTTPAYVLESNASGEADMFFTIFTSQLGLVRATAKSVRLQKSKLRYSLQNFSFSRISLVRGKDVWRITSAQIEESLSKKYKNDKRVLKVIAQIFALLRRLVGGEEKNEELFNIVSSALHFLETRTWQEEIAMFEIITVLKILENLGYLKQITGIDAFVKAEWSEEIIESFKPYSKIAVREINNALKETQL